jgi:hypothetical protein
MFAANVPCQARAAREQMVTMNPRPQRRFRVLSAISPVLVLGGGVSYVALLDVPFLRSTGLLAFLVMGLGTALSVVALAKARGPWTWAVAGANVLMTVTFTYYFFVFAVLPEVQGLPRLTQAPDFAVRDHSGATVRLNDALASGPVLLVFFRGHW